MKKMTARDEKAKPPPTWEQQRKAVADKWFEGDEDKAGHVLDALPYNYIPGWEDVETVMLAIKPSTDNIESERR